MTTAANASLLSTHCQILVVPPQITTPQEERRDEEELYHKMTLADLQRLSPFVNWVSYVNHLLSVTEYQVTSQEKVLVYAPEFLTRVSNLVSEMLKTEETRA